MPKPATRSVPHFILVTEDGTDRRIAINTLTLHSFHEAAAEDLSAPPVTYLYLTNGTTYVVKQSPATILSQIYSAEIGEDN